MSYDQSSKKNEDQGEVEELPWIDRIQKSQVLHEAKKFSDPQVDPNLCRQIIVEILYLMNTGDILTPDEVQDVFFGASKLFQNDDASLRRLVYLIVTEVNPDPGEAFMIVSTLMQDVTKDRSPDLFRGNAIRVLSKIIDPTILPQLDRHIKQNVVSRDPFISSSALMAGIRLFPTNQDIIKRWVNEVQDAVKSSSKMVQFHALHLLQKIKQHDRGALKQVVTALTRKSTVLRSPFAKCLLIRYIVQVIGANPSPAKPLVEYLTHSLRAKQPMVMYEAARALCGLTQLPESTIMPATSVLQELLSSPVPTQRFAAVRTLSQLINNFPNAVVSCQVELEHLQSDSNRTISTLALTTLLKTGGKESIDRLVKSLTNFIAEIPDELRVVLVDAVRTACLKHPDKHVELLSFLSSVLREEGGLAYKRTIVNAIEELMEKIPTCKEAGLEHLCEFIEDCEFPELSVRILHLLGDEAQHTSNPSRYIRFVFNRVILELPEVRCAAVSSLAKFGATVPSLTNNVCILLRRCLIDNDDEVRDRATYYLEALGDEQGAYLLEDLGVAIPDLEYSIQRYLENDTSMPFTLDQVVQNVEAVKESQAIQDSTDGEPSLLATSNESEDDERELRSIPDFAKLGEKFRVTESVNLTETESEYVVSYVKYIFADFIVLRFNIVNTIEDQILENVTVELDTDGQPEDCPIDVEVEINAARVLYNKSANAYCAIRRTPDLFESEPIPATLKFTSKDADSANLDFEEGLEDEYPIDDVSISVTDFVLPQSMALADFKTAWLKHKQFEKTQRYSYDQDNLQDVLDEIWKPLGLHPIDGGEFVPAGVEQHGINLSGVFCRDSEDGTLERMPVLVRAVLRVMDKNGRRIVGAKIAARCPDPVIGERLITIT